MPHIGTHLIDTNCGSVQVYNGLDALMTSEVLGELKSLLPSPDASPELHGPQLIYDFERALQAPAIEMMLRGWRIDPWAREAGTAEIRRRLKRLSHIIDCLVSAVAPGLRSPTKRSNDLPAPICLNPDSDAQLRNFLYDYLRIPPIVRKRDGEDKMPMDREVLEKLETYFLARPIIAAVLAYRDNRLQLQVFEAEVDEDWRMRTTFGVTTTTGRFASSKSITGSGRNLQNIEEALRYPFIADAGKKLIGADLEQAETRETGWLCGVLFGDWSYLEDAESGDPHTNLAKIIWEKELPWTGDKARDRAIADRLYHRHHSFREVAKRCRHATEKYGGPAEIAKQTSIPYYKAKEFQEKLFAAFPCLQKFYTWVAQQVQRERYLINAFGRRRDFFGRPDSNDTIKEAVAFMTQSPTADRLNLGLWRVWKYMGNPSRSENHFELLAQLHDAIYGQRSETETDEEAIITEIQHHLDVPMTFRGRRFTVPSEIKTGWCWSNAYEMDANGTQVLKHPNGLMKSPEKSPRTRIETTPNFEREDAA